MSDNYAIRIHDVTKIYKLFSHNRDRVRDALGLTRKKLNEEHYALGNVSFDVNEGETVGIIGTNGSGKSTILKIITGVLSPTTGDVKVNGRISALLELGAGFNQEYTGIENIYLNGTMIGFSKEEIDAKLQDILDFADIGEFVYQPVKTYSSGMFVRLAFAVAINIEPEILIVDEALSVGDIFFQNKCYHKFEEFKKQGKTILFVSHDLSSIAKYCDRVVLLNKGSMIDQGTPKEMIDLYKKILVGQNGKEFEAAGDDGVQLTDGSAWKDHFAINPSSDTYGSGRAEIVDFGIVDENGQWNNVLEKGSEFKVKARVKFYETLQDPIIAFQLKNIHGTTICGTNTMYEKNDLCRPQAGDTIDIEFKQKIDLQRGEYFLSLGCTGFENGELTVYHRLYDIIGVTVISDKATDGFYDINTEITVKKL